MTFDSYYWHDARLDRPELEQARRLVAAKRDRAAFEQLLRSGDPIAVGIALDQYHHADASTRHGTPSPFESYRDEVVAVARGVLRGAAISASDNIEEGANYASALGALMNLAEPADAPLILDALRRVQTSSTRFAAAAAASTALEKSASPDEDLVAALENIAFDDSSGRDARDAAVSAIGRTRSASATSALIRMTGLADLRLQASAALHLLSTDLRAHRSHVENLVRRWPRDAPYPANEVIDLLEEQES